jgi:hypothetical protein
MGADRTLMQVKVRCGLGRVGVFGRLQGNCRGMPAPGSKPKSRRLAVNIGFSSNSGHCSTCKTSPKSAMSGSHSILVATAGGC